MVPKMIVPKVLFEGRENYEYRGKEEQAALSTAIEEDSSRHDIPRGGATSGEDSGGGDGDDDVLAEDQGPAKRARLGEAEASTDKAIDDEGSLQQRAETPIKATTGRGPGRSEIQRDGESDHGANDDDKDLTLPESKIGTTVWTSEDKEQFFFGFKRKFNQPLVISRRMRGQKTVGQVAEYMSTLEYGLLHVRDEGLKARRDYGKQVQSLNKDLLLSMESSEATIQEEERVSRTKALRDDGIWLRAHYKEVMLRRGDRRAISRKEEEDIELFDIDAAKGLLCEVYDNPYGEVMKKTWHEYYKLVRRFVYKLIRKILLYKAGSLTQQQLKEETKRTVTVEDVAQVIEFERVDMDRLDRLLLLVRDKMQTAPTREDTGGDNNGEGEAEAVSPTATTPNSPSGSAAGRENGEVSADTE
ncbi:hypothetical protein EV182_000233 [Spiromyces aspiralis]|uniref:Uncharacterized protein n=1 Tax=Spiromyces aspiralis TaxID=68401 RepID=A0ACC1HUS4_9FUNG|nr:hypothetical protein EV182_000233 [Spiromyces aspiralis]